MQKAFIYLLAIIGIISSCNTAPEATGRNGATFKTPSEYNDYIISRQLEVVGLIDEFAAASGVSIDSAFSVLQRSSRTTNEYLGDIASMSDFKGDSAFRNAAINSFTFYKRIFDREYKDLLAINAKGDRASQEEITRAQAITQSLSAEEAELDKRFSNAQKDFAQKNKLRLQDPAVLQSDSPNVQD